MRPLEFCSQVQVVQFGATLLHSLCCKSKRNGFLLVLQYSTKCNCDPYLKIAFLYIVVVVVLAIF
jgi:hypothetical protein